MNNDAVANASIANYHKHIKRVDTFVFLTIATIVLGIIALILSIVLVQQGTTSLVNSANDSIYGIYNQSSSSNSSSGDTSFPVGTLAAMAIFWILTFIVGLVNFIYAALILGSLSSLQYSDNPLIAKIYQENYSICLILFIVGIFVGLAWIILIVFYVKTKNQLKQVLEIQTQ